MFKKQRKPSDKPAGEFRKAVVSGLGGLTVAAMAATGVWLTPLRDVVTSWIWQEQVEILATASPSQPEEGDELEITIVAVPKTPIAITPGVLTVRAENDLLQPIGGTEPRSTSAFSSAQVLTASSPARFVATAAGEAKVTVRLRTRSDREFVQTLPVQVRQHGPSGSPKRRNWSGAWALAIGAEQGEMELSQETNANTVVAAIDSTRQREA